MNEKLFDLLNIVVFGKPKRKLPGGERLGLVKVL